MKRLILFVIFIILNLPGINLIIAQEVKIHSHNDYYQVAPFYQAYAQKVFSIEVDVFYKDSLLLVGHDWEELKKGLTIEELYINPIVDVFNRNGGRIWKDSNKKLTLLVDLKTEYEPALNRLVSILNRYPEIFGNKDGDSWVRVVVSGNMPQPEKFNDYPSYIYFDGRLNTEYNDDQRQRLAMVSASFRDFSRWNGKGALIAGDKVKIEKVITEARRMNLPIRFWGSPDGVTAWNTLHKMGVDIINTDRVEACSDFFNNYEEKVYSITQNELGDSEVVNTDRLDKITSGFRGFDKNEIQLTKNIEIYQPTYLNDGEEKTVKNVILLIGDGMGMNHITAAEAVNKGLTMLNINHIGLHQSIALDSYTSDSAASGSSNATGKPHKNRYIATDTLFNAIPSITDYAFNRGMGTGVVTTGNIADATPAAFYGHSAERDSADAITRFLLDGKLDIVIGGGTDVFTKREDGLSLKDFEKVYNFTSDINKIESSKTPLLCIDDKLDPAVTEESLGMLAFVTKGAIHHLSQKNDNGFFLMVEGAKIDYAGHANSLSGTISEMLSFDMAVAEALKFADENGETLVIVTSDHETGGLILVDGDDKKGEITARFTTDDHTPSFLGVFAYGPGAQHFTGFYPNYEIANKIISILNLK
ncbi:MAG: alkaline phosphatase [Fermentimonas sp.]|nr:alkaline phosphatase [Fermentimonas sp.]